MLILGLALSRAIAAEAPQTETIVLVRHGEKPSLGLGQLNCQGLNRSLALPAIIGEFFGKPDALFAPDPSKLKEDSGHPYNYIRPLATIEPTAITFGLPVDTSIGFSDIDALRRKLEATEHRNALVLVAWEHAELAKLARDLLTDYGADPGSVPDWPGDDFDSVYVVKVMRTGLNTTIASFEHRNEGLDGQANTCPGQTPR